MKMATERNKLIIIDTESPRLEIYVHRNVWHVYIYLRYAEAPTCPITLLIPPFPGVSTVLKG